MRRCLPRRCWPSTTRMSPNRCPRSASARATRSPATTTRASRSGADVTTVGILGGGQLARMLALAGAPLGLRFLVMDTQPDACAGQFAPLLVGDYRDEDALRSEEHTSELQSLMRISYAVFCLNTKK